MKQRLPGRIADVAVSPKDGNPADIFATSANAKWSALKKQQKSWIFCEVRLELHTIFVQVLEK